MIGVLPITRIIGIVAVCYAALVALLAAVAWSWSSTDPNAWALVRWALKGATALQLVLLLAVHWAWRAIWRLVPKLNEWVFPDLNGNWHIEIDWHGPIGKGSGTLAGTAIIKINLLKISMDVVTPRSVSHTLAVVAQKDPESGRPRLAYVFRVNPQGVPGPDGIPYRGAAILDHYGTGTSEVLRGKYWTERQTVGEYVLRRLTEKEPDPEQ